MFDEIKGQIRRLSKPGELKKILHSQMVVSEEFYFFPKAVIPQKVVIEVETKPPNNIQEEVSTSNKNF